MEPEVQLRTLRFAGNDAQRFDPDPLQLFPRDAQLSDVPTAERSIHPSEDGEQDRTRAEVVGQRDDPVPVDGWQAEVRGWLARLDR